MTAAQTTFLSSQPLDVTEYIYHVRVAAVSTAGEGPFSSPVVFESFCNAGDLTIDPTATPCVPITQSMHCGGATCDPLPQRSNGSFSTSGPTHPATATLTCDAGFEVDGTRTIDCLGDGSWSPAPPSCRGVLCSALPSVANGVWMQTSNRYPATATLTCDAGFGLTAADAMAACSSSGSWQPAPLSGARCVACAVGEYAPTATSQCVACGTCDPGSVRQGCRQRSEGTCVPCPSGCVALRCVCVVRGEWEGKRVEQGK